MSVIGSNILAGASGQGGDYTIARSLRFRKSAGAYLSRTPASAGNRKTWTYSTWLKRGALSYNYCVLFEASDGSGNNEFMIRFNANNTITVQSYIGAYQLLLDTTQVFRDPSAWYHIVLTLDTTQATASNRCKLYVNGTQVTSFTTATYPSQNYDGYLNLVQGHYLGWDRTVNENFDGYMTEVNFIDGQALTPSSFGANNASTGVWQPKKYAGTYGTNGFYLPFSDNASTTTLGSDFSGNGNNWTTNNISLTAGSTYDSMTDVPTLTSATASNFATLNPISNPNSPIYTISAGNLNYSCSGSTGNAPKMAVLGSILMQGSGKYYCEATETSLNSTFGVTSGLVAGGTANGVNFATVYNGGTNSSAATYSGTTPSFTSGDVIGLAFDVSALTLAIYKNGTLLGTLSGLESTVNGWLFLQTVGTGTLSTSAVWNFGQRPFAYTPPTGFVALNTFNLPTPTIGATASTQANKYFDATTWTGDGSSNRAIVNAGNMASDFVWIKNRSGTTSHRIFDSVRGVNKRLVSNATDAEASPADELNSFNSNGFTVGADADVNANAVTYVGWNWNAGSGNNVTNTAGSITSTVSANTSAGFSVVTYTGNGSSGATVGHGLGAKPNIVFYKRRDSTSDWLCLQDIQGSMKYGYLNTTASFGSAGETAPTSSVLYLSGGSDSNASGGTYVAYCFSEVAGYSKFSSYVGNGSTDGTFIFTGFRPKFVMVKGSSAAEGWTMWDSSRSSSNTASNFLYANLSNAESSPAEIDFVANGFKFRNTSSQGNVSGRTYIYMAFAEVPTKFALAR